MRKQMATLLAALALTSSGFSQERLTEPYLEKGELKAARQAVDAAMQTAPSEELRLQLALVQLLQGVERYAQTMHKMGLHESLFEGMIPFLRFPVEANPDPSVATNPAVRQALETLYGDLQEAQRTLSEILTDGKDGCPFDWAGSASISTEMESPGPKRSSGESSRL